MIKAWGFRTLGELRNDKIHLHVLWLHIILLQSSDSGIWPNVSDILENIVALYKSHLLHRTYILENKHISHFNSLLGGIKPNTGIHLGDTLGSIPDQSSKVSIIIQQVTEWHIYIYIYIYIYRCMCVCVCVRCVYIWYIWHYILYIYMVFQCM